jgi:hypothetical protein
MVTVSTIFQLYRGGQFYRWRKLEYPEKTSNLPKTNHQLEMGTSLKWFRKHYVGLDIWLSNI